MTIGGKAWNKPTTNAFRSEGKEMEGEKKDGEEKWLCTLGEISYRCIASPCSPRAVIKPSRGTLLRGMDARTVLLCKYIYIAHFLGQAEGTTRRRPSFISLYYFFFPRLDLRLTTSVSSESYGGYRFRRDLCRSEAAYTRTMRAWPRDFRTVV